MRKSTSWNLRVPVELKQEAEALSVPAAALFRWALKKEITARRFGASLLNGRTDIRLGDWAVKEQVGPADSAG